MKITRTLVSIGALAATATVLSIPPSQAATTGGFFKWAATISTGVKSRTWTTDATGPITIVANFPCWNPAVSTYTVVLIREKFGGDQRYMSVNYKCGSAQQYTWNIKGGLPIDQYHFNLTKATDGITVSGSGSVTYK